MSTAAKEDKRRSKKEAKDKAMAQALFSGYYDELSKPDGVADKDGDVNMSGGEGGFLPNSRLAQQAAVHQVTKSAQKNSMGNGGKHRWNSDTYRTLDIRARKQYFVNNSLQLPEWFRTRGAS